MSADSKGSDADIAIRVDGVSKTFKLPHEKSTSVKSLLIDWTRHNRGYEKQHVLKGVSFAVKKGEFFGIVGRNGSGKSTLLKLLAGIYTPDKGDIHLNGKLTPFIELGVGFSPELTGRENVFLNGALLGFSRKEMTAMYKDIVEFAELEDFMDQKLKNYSSGMQVRLAFSIAIRARSDILLLDEVLAVGDADFQRKCLRYFTLLKRDKKTVVFVSHDMESVKKFCDKVILIEDGKLTLEGTAQDVVPEFMSRFVERIDANNPKKANDLPLGMSSAVTIDDSVLEIGRIWLEDAKGKQFETLDANMKEYAVCFVVEPKKNLKGFVPGVIITNDFGEFVVAANAKWGGSTAAESLTGKKKYRIKFTLQNIYEQGNYAVSVNAVSNELDVFYAWKNNASSFFASKPYLTGGKANPPFAVEITQL